MRKIKTEVVVIGDGGAAIFAAKRLLDTGAHVTLINPNSQFGISDLRCQSPLCLWNALYRGGKSDSLPDFYDALEARLRETLPAPSDESGLKRVDFWSILSSTPVHRKVTEDIEKEFFKLERRSWAEGQIRVLNPEHANTRMQKNGIDFTAVAHVDGAVERSYGVQWDGVRIGYYLTSYLSTKFYNSEIENACIFTNVKLDSQVGRQLRFTVSGEKISLEADKGILVFLTGDILPHLKKIIASCNETWIQGIRKRRREQISLHFKRDIENLDSDFWVQLGQIQYSWSGRFGSATWVTQKGPDGVERVIDEALRIHSSWDNNAKYFKSERHFRLEWEWKNSQWKQTKYNTHWATGFEGDLWAILELMWTIPLK